MMVLLEVLCTLSFSLAVLYAHTLYKIYIYDATSSTLPLLASQSILSDIYSTVLL